MFNSTRTPLVAVGSSLKSYLMSFTRMLGIVSTPPFPLLELPPEIRRMIYGEFMSTVRAPRQGEFTDKSDVFLTSFDIQRKKKILYLLLSCRKISEEAQDVFYSHCVFHPLKPFVGYWLLDRKNRKYIQNLRAMFELYVAIEQDNQPVVEYTGDWEVSLTEFTTGLVESLPRLRSLQVALDFRYVEWKR